jgi:oligopeptide transport system substrate-binding protein
MNNNKKPLALFAIIGALLVAIVVLVVVVAGGGGSSNGDNASGSGGSGGKDSGSGSGNSVNADLRLLGSDPITLDPALAGDAESATYIVEIYSGLVTLDKDVKIAPDLAESWDISADGTVYTFHLRNNAQFHDGRPVTAEDVKYSIERTANPKTTSITADAYLGDIVGARDMIRGRATSISGVKVIDSRTLQITIDGAKPYFLAKLTYPTAFVVDKTQVESNPRNWTRKPNATGPYKLQEWRINERIILQANDNFYLGAPAVKRVLFNLAGGSSLTQYQNGDIDVSGIGPNDIDRVQNSKDPLSKDYVSAPNLSISYVGFDTKQKPFDDPKVRQAFALAIDKEQIAHIVLKDMIPVANSFMQPGLPGYNPSAKAPGFDASQAKALLSQSKYGSAAGLGTITLTEVGAGATSGPITEAIVQMWKQNLGVDVSISQSEAAAFFDDLDQGKLQMFESGWIMDYPDPEDIIDLLFYSQSRQNSSHYSNPDFDKLVVQARTEQDVTKRLGIYQQAEQLLLQDLPWVPLFFSKDHLVVKPYVKGYAPTPMVIEHLRSLSIQK